MKDYIDEIKEKIIKADKILIGWGKELYNIPETDFCNNSEENFYTEWFNKCFNICHREKINEEENCYNLLAKILHQKDYFCITTETNLEINQSNLDKERLVMPCGSEQLFQCIEKCENMVWNNREYFGSILEQKDKIISILEKKEYNKLENFMPKCPFCGGKVDFNIYGKAEKYSEKGYMRQWNNYKQWLAQTLNKNLLIIEIGVDFYLPNIIRWPFEKAAILNQQAFFIRVNTRFPQFPEELKNKAIAILENSNIFLKLISNTLSE